MAIDLKEGQEFFVGDQRYVIKDGVPVAEAKRGPLGGELVRFDSLKILDCFTITFDKISDDLARCITPCFKTEDRKDTGVVTCGFVEINIPQPQRGRIMTAGEAAKLPDIVGKQIIIRHNVLNVNEDFYRPLRTMPEQKSGDINWYISDQIIVEVLD